MTLRTHRRIGAHTAIALLAATALLGTACGSDDDPATDDPTTTAAAGNDNTGTDTGDGSATTAPTDDRRIVALGEEFLLADLLALGVRPVASTATVSEVGFQGIDDDTTGIEPLPSYEANLERLAGLRPDLIVVSEFIAEQVGLDQLEALAEVYLLDDGLTGEPLLTELGELFDRTDRATELLEEYEGVVGEVKADVPDDCTVSVGTVYPGRSVAAWVSEPNDAASLLTELGCTLVPSTDLAPPDQSGRIFLSEEQIEQLSAPTMVLLQNSSVEGEDDAVAAMADSPLWSGLPSVSSGKVTTLDRLGYAGLPGRERLARDLVDALDG